MREGSVVFLTVYGLVGFAFLVSFGFLVSKEGVPGIRLVGGRDTCHRA